MSINILNQINQIKTGATVAWRALKYRKTYRQVIKQVSIVVSMLVLALSPAFTNIAHATSNYGVTLTSSLELGGVDGSSNECDVVDMTTRWAEIMDQSGASEYSYKNTYNVTNSFPSYAEDHLDAFAEEFWDNVSEGSGWAVMQGSQYNQTNPSNPNWDTYNKSILIILFDPEAEFEFVNSPWERMNIDTGTIKYISYYLNVNNSCIPYVWKIGTQIVQNAGTYWNFGNGETLFWATDSITYAGDYSGDPIPDTLDDADGDGLSAPQEATQGTSDNNGDTDGDGVGTADLSDYVESIWYPDRDDVFCDVNNIPDGCAYPSPTQMDLYYQIDWMDDGVNDPYKPTSTQIEIVEDMFEEHGILFHADTGDYGDGTDGGNELSTYTASLRRTPTGGQVDYLDYKVGGDGISANFPAERDTIWRYMITGNNFYEYPTKTGWAQESWEDAFISIGVINGMANLVSLDRAIAGTMAHEIGHNLCLVDSAAFEETPAECEHSEMETLGSTNYPSVMNYTYQTSQDDVDHDDLGVVDYSTGENETDDHDDWAAVMLGIGLYTGSHT